MEKVRHNLEVIRAEFEEVKALGALWDDKKNVWYILTDDVEYTLKFSQWSPDLYNVRADWFYVLKTDCLCPHCSKITDVYGIMLPPDGEYLAVDELYEGDDDYYQDDINKYFWTTHEDGYQAPLENIINIENSLIETILSLSSDIKIDTVRKRITNQCTHCKRGIADRVLYDRPDSPFFPFHSGGMELIQKLRVQKRFFAHADGYGGYNSVWNDDHHLVKEVYSFDPDAIPHFESDTTPC